ncbi:hypothetical protein SAMN05216244_2828 [Sediminibacillus halophilus]|uniref:Uncharacterized protein n=1 Tax=Sediminibacillus halophilus TaxID=482461 RepID=A0A1G9U361_9BACI|nr:hypothetical protein SAMN05216244_2828 [Sediminibacillus halophilus]
MRIDRDAPDGEWGVSPSHREIQGEMRKRRKTGTDPIPSKKTANPILGTVPQKPKCCHAGHKQQLLSKVDTKSLIKGTDPQTTVC